MSEKQVVKGQHLCFAETARKPQFPSRLITQWREKKSDCQIRFISHWFAFPKCQWQTASKVKLFQLVFEVQLI